MHFMTSFNYLDSTVTQEGVADNDVRIKIGKARTAFAKVSHIWKFSKNTIVRLYDSCVLSVLLYWEE